MSTAEFGDPNLGQAPAPAPEVPLAPLTLTPPAPIEPLVQPAIVAPVATPAAPVPVSDMRDVPLGTLIFREGLLTEEQLEEALQDGMQRGKRLGEVLLERGLVSENDLGRLLAGQKGLPFVQLDAAAIDPAAVQLLPVEKARLHSILPIGFQDGLPVVAVADPTNDLVLENVRRALNCNPHLVVAGREALHRQIETAYAAVPGGQPAPTQLVAPPPPAPAVQVEPVQPLATAEPALVAQPVVAEPVAPPLAADPLSPPPVPPQAPAAPQFPEQQPVVTVEPTQPASVPPLAVEPQAVVQAEPVLQPEPLPPVAPLIAAEPVLEPPVVAQPAPEQPAPEPLSISVTPVVEEPPAVVAAEPAVVVPEPPVSEPVPEPMVEQSAPEEETEPVLTWFVFLRLADGDRLDIGAFHSSAEAREHAKNVVEQISSDSGWPFFEGRFLRPEAIVSVDLVEPEGRWLGSAARRAAWQG